MKKLLLVGAGGHCRVVIDSLLSLGEYEIVGILDRKENIGKMLGTVKIIGQDEDAVKLFKEGVLNCFVTIGSVGDYSLRKKVIDKMKNIGFNMVSIIDKSAILANDVKIGEGVFVGKNSVINANTIIKNFAIVGTGAIIDHDCVINEYVHISAAAMVAGVCCVGYGTHVGLSTTLLQGVAVGKNTLIGAGSLVLGDVGDNLKLFGLIKK